MASDYFNAHTTSNVSAWPVPSLDDLQRCKEAIDALGPAPKFTGCIFVDSNLPAVVNGKSVHWELNKRGDVLVSEAMLDEIQKRFPCG